MWATVVHTKLQCPYIGWDVQGGLSWRSISLPHCTTCMLTQAVLHGSPVPPQLSLSLCLPLSRSTHDYVVLLPDPHRTPDAAYCSMVDYLKSSVASSASSVRSWISSSSSSTALPSSSSSSSSAHTKATKSSRISSSRSSTSNSSSSSGGKSHAHRHGGLSSTSGRPRIPSTWLSRMATPSTTTSAISDWTGSCTTCWATCPSSCHLLRPCRRYRRPSPT